MIENKNNDQITNNKMRGILAYLNYQVPKKREEILAKLINGLKRLEYRGYDSAGEYIPLTLLVYQTGHIVGQIAGMLELGLDLMMAPNGTNPGLFQLIFHLKMSHFCVIWGQSETFLVLIWPPCQKDT